MSQSAVAWETESAELSEMMLGFVLVLQLAKLVLDCWYQDLELG